MRRWPARIKNLEAEIPAACTSNSKQIKQTQDEPQWIVAQRATLNTYNTWIQLGRLRKIYHFHRTKLCCNVEPLAALTVSSAVGPTLSFVMWQW